MIFGQCNCGLFLATFGARSDTKDIRVTSSFSFSGQVHGLSIELGLTLSLWHECV